VKSDYGTEQEARSMNGPEELLKKKCNVGIRDRNKGIKEIKKTRKGVKSENTKEITSNFNVYFLLLYIITIIQS
jgi:hypothetical protein